MVGARLGVESYVKVLAPVSFADFRVRVGDDKVVNDNSALLGISSMLLLLLLLQFV